MNNILLPFISKQWRTLHENLFYLENVKKKIHFYYNTYHLDELLIYKEIIHAFEIMLSEHEQLEDLEKKMYNTTKDLSTMIYKTSIIRLKPEYELYDLILGKPDRNKNEKYDESIIQQIERLVQMENMNFQRIKDIIIAKKNEI